MTQFYKEFCSFKSLIFEIITYLHAHRAVKKERHQLPLHTTPTERHKFRKESLPDLAQFMHLYLELTSRMAPKRGGINKLGEAVKATPNCRHVIDDYGKGELG